MTLPRLLLALLVAVTVLPRSAGTTEAPAAVTHITLAHTQRQDPATEPAAAQAAEFKRQVELRTGGTVKVEIFPDGQLGGNRDMARLVGRNIIQTAFVTVGGLAPVYPLIAVLEMPFVLSSPAAAYAVYDGGFGIRLAADIERRTDLAVLGFGDSGGFLAITNARRPLRSPADLRGVKIRTIPGFGVLDAMIRGLGGVPVKVSSREEYTALAAGVVDGEMNPPGVILSSRFDEVQKYVTLTRHLYVPTVWVFNREAFAGLSPAQQEAVRQSAVLAVAAGRAVAATVEASDHGLPALRRRLQVTTLTAAERKAFKDAAQPAVAAFLAQALGADGTRLLHDFLAAAGGR